MGKKLTKPIGIYQIHYGNRPYLLSIHRSLADALEWLGSPQSHWWKARSVCFWIADRRAPAHLVGNQ